MNEHVNILPYARKSVDYLRSNPAVIRVHVAAPQWCVTERLRARTKGTRSRHAHTFLSGVRIEVRDGVHVQVILAYTTAADAVLAGLLERWDVEQLGPAIQSRAAE